MVLALIVWNFGPAEDRLSNLRVLHCLFASRECSLAVGTWTLSYVTGAAFAAAYGAYYFAFAADTRETALSLGQKRCTQDHDDPDAECYLLPTGRMATTLPDQYALEQFLVQEHALINLGRSSAIDVRVKFVFDYPDESIIEVKKSGEHEIAIGNLLPYAESHVRIGTALEFGKVRTRWIAPACHGANRTPLSFHPGNPIHGEQMLAMSDLNFEDEVEDYSDARFRGLLGPLRQRLSRLLERLSQAI